MVVGGVGTVMGSVGIFLDLSCVPEHELRYGDILFGPKQDAEGTASWSSSSEVGWTAQEVAFGSFLAWLWIMDLSSPLRVPYAKYPPWRRHTSVEALFVHRDNSCLHTHISFIIPSTGSVLIFDYDQ